VGVEDSCTENGIDPFVFGTDLFVLPSAQYTCACTWHPVTWSHQKRVCNKENVWYQKASNRVSQLHLLLGKCFIHYITKIVLPKNVKLLFKLWESEVLQHIVVNVSTGLGFSTDECRVSFMKQVAPPTWTSYRSVLHCNLHKLSELTFIPLF
jgi:hypothetical protein